MIKPKFYYYPINIFYINQFAIQDLLSRKIMKNI